METNFSSNRYEIKFIVPVKEFENIKHRLSDTLESDIYHDDVNDGYYNHSIYFDTPEVEHYYLKREGMNRRVKLRLRAHQRYFSITLQCHVIILSNLNLISRMG